MGVFGWAGKTLKREALHVAGGAGIAGWWRSARTSWLSTKRVCPACGEGRMFPFTELVEGESRKFFGCSRCDHFEAVNLSNSEDVVAAESLSRLREIAASRLGSLSPQERERRNDRMKVASRLQYLFSVGLLVFAVVLLFRTDAIWPPLNVAAFSVLLFAHGLRSSYRYWQVRNNILYQPGSFRRWLGLGQWLV